MLDPACRKLRKRYHDLTDILETVNYRVARDSVRQEVRQHLERHNIESALVCVDQMLSMLAHDDSTRNGTKNLFDSLVSVVKSGNSMHAYSLLAALNNTSKEDLEELRATMHEAFDERIAQLSASLDSDSIRHFMSMYPGVRPDDLNALLERSRTAQRQSLLRHPSFQGYAQYRDMFGDDEKLKKSIRRNAFKRAFTGAADPGPLKEYIALFPEEEQETWKTFEELLYKEWTRRQTRTAAQEYLRLFPNGRYASMISSVSTDYPVAEEDYY